MRHMRHMGRGKADSEKIKMQFPSVLAKQSRDRERVKQREGGEKKSRQRSVRLPDEAVGRNLYILFNWVY